MPTEIIRLRCDHADDPACPMTECQHRRPHQADCGCDEPGGCDGYSGKAWATVQCIPIKEANDAD